MSDFPDYIYAFEAERFEAGPVRVIADDIPGYDGKYIEYIRSDLVPQWRPIEMLTTNERVIVLFDNDHIDSGWLDNIDERRFFRTGHGKLPLTRLTHWMPIPKVPE